MRQQINLFQDELRERKAVLPGRQVVFALLAVSALCVLAALWMAQRAATPRDELLRVNAALAERQASVAELGERLEARQPDATLAEQARHLERRLQHLRRLVDIASRPAADAPLSTFVAGLGRQRPQGLWLRGVHIGNGGADLVLHGSVIDADLLPVYLEGLGREKAFAGLSFGELDIVRGGNGGRWLDFRVIAGCRHGGCTTDGGEVR